MKNEPKVIYMVFVAKDPTGNKEVVTEMATHAKACLDNFIKKNSQRRHPRAFEVVDRKYFVNDLESAFAYANTLMDKHCCGRFKEDTIDKNREA